MKNTELSEAKRKVIHFIKRQGPTTAAELAQALELTGVAVRQHLQSLEAGGLVQRGKRPSEGRGRPALLWSLTELARELFPDRHSELTVGLIDAMRHALGEDALERVLEIRSREQIDRYRGMMPGSPAPLKARVEALARERTAEGYMAEVVTERSGAYLLVEHHCPICEAARCCQGLCSGELEVFRATLGPDVRVERTAHLLSGDDRCAYRIRKR